MQNFVAFSFQDHSKLLPAIFISSPNYSLSKAIKMLGIKLHNLADVVFGIFLIKEFFRTCFTCNCCYGLFIKVKKASGTSFLVLILSKIFVIKLFLI